GWTDDMAALMRAADALVENAGGLSALEAFASDLPVVTYLPIAGHGRDNARLMAAAGVSEYARDEAELGRALARVTSSLAHRQLLVRRASRLFAGDVADDVRALA